METLPSEPIVLVAMDSRRTIRRRWQLVVGRDLFGHISIETR